MVAKRVVLTNREGLHVRPAGLFSNEMQKYIADVWVCREEAVVSGKSIMNLIAACCMAWRGHRALEWATPWFTGKSRWAAWSGRSLT